MVVSPFPGLIAMEPGNRDRNRDSLSFDGASRPPRKPTVPTLASESDRPAITRSSRDFPWTPIAHTPSPASRSAPPPTNCRTGHQPATSTLKTPSSRQNPNETGTASVLTAPVGHPGSRPCQHARPNQTGRPSPNPAVTSPGRPSLTRQARRAVQRPGQPTAKPATNPPLPP